MPTRLPGLTGANGIRLSIRGEERGGSRAPDLLAFSSLGPSGEEVRLGLTYFSTNDARLRSVALTSSLLRTKPLLLGREAPAGVPLAVGPTDRQGQAWVYSLILAHLVGH
jgi:hypothetical protein